MKKKQLIQLWNYLSKLRKRQFWLLLVLMIIASLSEIISLGAVLPFLGILTSPEAVSNHPLVQPLKNILEISSPDELALPFTIIFICAALFAGATRFALLYAMTRLSYATGADLSIEVYKRTLYQDYSVHVSRNSSEVINGIISKTGIVINGVISPVLMILSSIILLMGIVVVLFSINYLIALSTFFGFGMIYYLIIRFSKKQLKSNSQIIANQSTQMIKSLQEGLGGIRDVLIDGSQQFYCKLYQSADLPMRKASGSIYIISGGPRFFIESIGMTLIAVIAFVLLQKEDGLSTIIPVLGALALGAQRMLPMLQNVYSSLSLMRGAQSSFEDVLDLLEQPLPEYINDNELKPIKFEREITLKGVGFKYSKDSAMVLQNINLSIPKGSRIGFMGETGSGKSTLLDIIMGLLFPTSGEIRIDNQFLGKVNFRAWQKHIAHVPQSIFLSDGTIEENIAFGVPKESIDHDLVRKAAEQAQIAKTIQKMPNAYKSLIGERGVRLSGGQRQRIGIARALYKKADVLIFDEATSALDTNTENEVMNSIKALSKDLTILIIAHRLSTLEECDEIIKIDGKNMEIYNPNESIKID